MDKSELLAPEENWVQRNLISPANEALIADIYSPVKNVVNAISVPLLQKKLLPEASIGSGQIKHARELSINDQPVEYCTQLLARGAVGAFTYTACGFASGGMLKVAAGKMALEGAAAKIAASESTAMITGAAAHDAFLDARNERERAGNICAAVASFSTFEAFRVISPKNVTGKLIAHLSSGALGGAAGHATKSAICGEPLDAKALSKASLDGAALNMLFPAARWYGGRVLDYANVKLGRGIPFERYLADSDIQEHSPTFKGLSELFPLVRIQPSSDSMSVSYANKRIHLIDAGTRISVLAEQTQEKLAGTIAHELCHLDRRSIKEMQLKEAAKLLSSDPESSKRLFLKARISDELAVRRIENNVLAELSLSKSSRDSSKAGEAHALIGSDLFPSSYLRRFNADFESFKSSNGEWRPDKDYALISSEKREQLKVEADAQKIVPVLYPELPEQHQSAIADRLNQITETTNTNPYDLLYGMPRKAWQRSVTWLTLTEFRKAKELKENSAFTDALEQHPSAKAWAQQLADTFRDLERSTKTAKKTFVDNVAPVIERYAIERTKLEEQKADIEQQEKQKFEDAQDRENRKHKERIAAIETEFDSAEKKILWNLRLTYPREITKLFEAQLSIGAEKMASSVPLGKVESPCSSSLSDVESNRKPGSTSSGNNLLSVDLKDFYKERRYHNAYFDGTPLLGITGSANRLFRNMVLPRFFSDEAAIAYNLTSTVSQCRIANSEGAFAKTEEARMAELRNSPEYKAFYEIAGPLVELAEKYGIYARRELQTCTELFPEVSKFRSLIFPKEISATSGTEGGTASFHDLSRERLLLENDRLKQRLSSTKSLRTGVTWNSGRSLKSEDSLAPIQKHYHQDMAAHVKNRYEKLRLERAEHQLNLENLRKTFETARVDRTAGLCEKISELENDKRQSINNEMSKAFQQLNPLRPQAVEKQKSIIKSYCSSGNSVDWLPEHSLSSQIFDAALPMAVLFGNDANAWHEKNTLTKCFERPRKNMPLMPLSPELREPIVRTELLKANDPASLARAWINASHQNKQEMRNLSPEDFLLALQALERFKTVNSLPFAHEAGKWNFDNDSYADAERIYMSSQSVPSPFPLDKIWTSGNYTGRFLPRSDTRTLFMGDYTGSCMRIGGANEDGVKWAQNSPDAGFFVIEHEKSKEVLAGSRVWNDRESNSTCVNSIQTKGEEGRLKIILEIYKQVAESLVSDGLTERVALGKSRIDFPGAFGLQPLPRSQFVQTPQDIQGLTDCSESQWLLAGQSS